MKRRFVLLSLLILLLVACSPNDGVEVEATEPASDPAATSSPSDEEAPAAATAQPEAPAPTAEFEPYPAPTEGAGSEAAAPAPTTAPESYPAEEESAADQQIWILRPLGTQCEEPSEYEYADVDEAVAALEDAGVEVFEAEISEWMVCTSCDCPTSEHFRALIAAEGLATAQTLDWYEE